MDSAQLGYLDYTNLWSEHYVTSVLGGTSVSAYDVYPNFQGIKYKYSQGGECGLIEMVRLCEDVLLFLNHTKAVDYSSTSQAIGDGGWVHIQFRMKGHGKENLGQGTPFIETPENSCFVFHYPSASVVTRENFQGNNWKTACLYIRPHLFKEFFGVPDEAFPKPLQWITGRSDGKPRSWTATVSTATVATVNDMLACDFRGHARSAYMRAKSTELIASLLASLNSKVVTESLEDVVLTERDIKAIKEVHNIINANIGIQMTLRELARKVGINRTKLAYGFKAVYGMPLQAYWRDIRLAHAKDLLRSARTSVTEAAFLVGYSELSSFTRAFVKHYGVQPGALRSNSDKTVLKLEESATKSRD